MVSKFISVSETCFQNLETALKNQQASVQGLETQIGQLPKLISERPQGSLPTNTEPNPREHLNAISTQDKEGFIALEAELMQETVASKGELILRVGDETITLQAHNSGITSNIEEDLFMKTEDYKSRNSMNGGRTNQEHPTNRTYTKTSPIPLQINLRYLKYMCFHKDMAKHTGELKAV
ncbi:hypothetical protein GOBAR_AA07629 [Gossypium barbadense]|uniref:Uncharacterized protein n=1 Tax=Gossypium barbadense TaxID=3634 RepID=A0A2P5YBM8_GOSBA|nr:hypothetical protein GOBAR_AA07629 [Gossypium barbadense]